MSIQEQQTLNKKEGILILPEEKQKQEENKYRIEATKTVEELFSFIKTHEKSSPQICDDLMINSINACRDSSELARMLLDNAKYALGSDVLNVICKENGFQDAYLCPFKMDEKVIVKDETPERKGRELIYHKAELSQFGYIDLKANKDGKLDIDFNEEKESRKAVEYLANDEVQKSLIADFKNPEKIQNLSGLRKVVFDNIKQVYPFDFNKIYMAEVGDDVSKMVLSKNFQIFAENSEKGIVSIGDGFKKLFNIIQDTGNYTLKFIEETAKGITWVGGNIWELIKGSFSSTKEQQGNLLDKVSKEYSIAYQTGSNNPDINDPKLKIDDNEYGFSASILRKPQTKNPNEQLKDGDELTLILRGTDDLKDVLSDSKFGTGSSMPSQVISMINLMERHPLLKEAKDKKIKINVSGHSLGGGLAQILAVLYPEQIGTTYTFNAPGAKKIDGSLGILDTIVMKVKNSEQYKHYKELLGNYQKNLDRKDLSFDNIINVRNKDQIAKVGLSVGERNDEFGSFLHFIEDMKNDLMNITIEKFNELFNMFKVRIYKTFD